MDKIETPEEFVDGIWGCVDFKIVKNLKSRDALIRADERKKIILSELGTMPSDLLALWMIKRAQSKIVSEPEEPHS